MKDLASDQENLTSELTPGGTPATEVDPRWALGVNPLFIIRSHSDLQHSGSVRDPWERQGPTWSDMDPLEGAKDSLAGVYLTPYNSAKARFF